MKQLVLPIAPSTDSQDMRFLAKRLEHVPLPQVYRLLQPDSYRHWAPLSVLAVATARAHRAPDDQWRRRLWWLIGEHLFRQDARLRDSIEAYTQALESRSARSWGFDLACLGARATCFGRAGMMRQAVSDQARLHEIIARAPLGRHLAAFLYQLAEEQFSDYGLLELARENYARAAGMYEQLGDEAYLAECVHNQALTYLYDWRPREALPLFLRAHRLWSRLAEVEKLAQVEGDLSDTFFMLRRYRRMLGAATRRYLLEKDEPHGWRGGLSVSLWSRASALHRLRRTSERNRAARQAIWVLESDLEATSPQREGKRALDLRLRLLGWQLKDGDIAGARESALLLASALLPLSSCGPVFSARLLTTLGALREALVGQDDVTGLERAGGHGDQPVPRTVRWAPVYHPLTAYYVGRSLARN